MAGSASPGIPNAIWFCNIWFCNKHLDLARQHDATDTAVALDVIDVAIGQTKRRPRPSREDAAPPAG